MVCIQMYTRYFLAKKELIVHVLITLMATNKRYGVLRKCCEVVIWEWNWMAREKTQESDTSRSPSEVATSIDFVNSVAYNGDIW